MTKKKSISLILVMMLAVLMFSTITSAKQNVTTNTGRSVSSQTTSGVISMSPRISYIDDMNVTRYLEFSQSCDYTAEWEEGYTGWFNRAIFTQPSNPHIDNTSIVLTLDPDTPSSVKSGSIAYIQYRINNTRHMLKCFVTCDEYGEVSMGATVFYNYYSN